MYLPTSITATLEFNISLTWSQGTLDRTFRKFFPREWLTNIKVPNMEDLINREELCAWRNWSTQHQVEADQSLLSWHRSGWIAIAAGCQRGAIHSKHQVQPLVGPGLTKEERLEYAVGLAGSSVRIRIFDLPLRTWLPTDFAFVSAGSGRSACCLRLLSVARTWILYCASTNPLQ